METGAAIVTLWPGWMRSVGAMQRINALVRSRCVKCGMLLRVDLADLAARYGPCFSLMDELDRCRLVGCDGATFFLASRTYGRVWTDLLSEPSLIARCAALPATRTALDLPGVGGSGSAAPSTGASHV